MHYPFTRGSGSQGAGTIQSRGRLLLPVAMLSTLGFMTLFESVKTLLFPSITIWQSHLITIAATTAIAGVIASFVLQRLRKSEANLIEAQAFAHIGNYEWEIGDDVVSWSPEMFRIYGISPETFDSKIASVTRRIHPEDVWRHEKCIADRLAGKPFEAYEYRVVRPDGSERIVQVLKSVLERDSAGEPLRISGVIMDITERRRAEKTLLEERMLLRSLIDNMPDRIYVKDAASRWVVANRAIAELVGAKNPTELIGKTDFDFWPKELAADFFTDEQNIIQSGKPLIDHVESRVDAQGNTLWTSTSKVPWRDESGQVIGIMGIGRDITERKSAEERFYKAFNASPEPITISTLLEGRYLDVNESYLRTTGYRREEVIGRTSTELNYWAKPEDRASLIDKLAQQGSVRDMEFAFRTKSGEQRIASHSADHFDLGAEECIICSHKDITEQKILEKQLRQAQKMEAVGRLSGGIAHDFNNLLGVIIGYSDILDDNLGENHKLQKNAREIKKAGQRAASLTRQLLAFSRQQVLEPKVLNLNTVVGETEKMLRRLIGEDIELTSSLAADLGQVKADQVQIEQVILNLAVNARDAMPHGGRLSIETHNAKLDEEYALRHPPTVPGNYVALLVSDTGVGMDTQTQLRIFEPFFTTKELGKGTGLGLATVYGVVKQSGGYIWVYSEPGLGSTFKVYLPRVDEVVLQRSHPEVITTKRTGAKTVLLVEDEESLRSLILTFLEQDGYTVLEAGDGKKAIEIAEQHGGPIHLLLTDVVMPEMNGPALAGHFAQAYPESKVVYMSGYSDFSRRGLLDAEAILLPKPFTRDALLSKLHEVLDSRKELTTM